MATLHLGVIDVPYKGEKKATTTGEVAQILEDEYYVMDIFYHRYEKEIHKIIEEAIANEIERMLSMERPDFSNINTSKIDDLFKSFLAADEWQKLTGIVIKAAQKGVSHRFKDIYNRKKKRGSRPAFIDTGLYQASFRSWIDSKNGNNR